MTVATFVHSYGGPPEVFRTMSAVACRRNYMIHKQVHDVRMDEGLQPEGTESTSRCKVIPTMGPYAAANARVTRASWLLGDVDRKVSSRGGHISAIVKSQLRVLHDALRAD